MGHNHSQIGHLSMTPVTVGTGGGETGHTEIGGNGNSQCHEFERTDRRPLVRASGPTRSIAKAARALLGSGGGAVRGGGNLEDDLAVDGIGTRVLPGISHLV